MMQNQNYGCLIPVLVSLEDVTSSDLYLQLRILKDLILLESLRLDHCIDGVNVMKIDGNQLFAHQDIAKELEIFVGLLVENIFFLSRWIKQRECLLSGRI
jgi:hypothetical protein